MNYDVYMRSVAVCRLSAFSLIGSGVTRSRPGAHRRSFAVGSCRRTTRTTSRRDRAADAEIADTLTHVYTYSYRRGDDHSRPPCPRRPSSRFPREAEGRQPRSHPKFALRSLHVQRPWRARSWSTSTPPTSNSFTTCDQSATVSVSLRIFTGRRPAPPPPPRRAARPALKLGIAGPERRPAARRR